jgi:hypothetical protein
LYICLALKTDDELPWQDHQALVDVGQIF